MNNFVKLVEGMLEHPEIGIDFLEKEVRLLFDTIRKTSNIDDAELIFKNLDDIQIELAKAAFVKGISLGEFLREFVRYFDRLDDVDYKSYLYTKIKSSGNAW